jgi:hypothetical protein
MQDMYIHVHLYIDQSDNSLWCVLGLIPKDAVGSSLIGRLKV